jgi:hypothetical protein
MTDIEDSPTGISNGVSTSRSVANTPTSRCSAHYSSVSTFGQLSWSTRLPSVGKGQAAPLSATKGQYESGYFDATFIRVRRRCVVSGPTEGVSLRRTALERILLKNSMDFPPIHPFRSFGRVVIGYLPCASAQGIDVCRAHAAMARCDDLCGLSLASLLRFWAVAASKNSSRAPHGPLRASYD